MLYEVITVQGRANIYSDIAQMIENSSGVLYLITTLEDISKMYHSVIPEKIKVSEKNGGSVRLLVEIDDLELTEFVKRFNSTETRICNLPSKGRIVVQQGNQLIMSDSGNANKLSQNSELDFSLCTNSTEMINNLNKFCEIRITSYNVCYTKLLRQKNDGDNLNQTI